MSKLADVIGPFKTIRGTIKTPTGPVAFDSFDTPVCKDHTSAVLGGRVYPRVPWIENVELVVDVGAHVGASACFFRNQYPRSKVLAIEPSTAAWPLLDANARRLQHVSATQIGLFDRDCELPTYLKADDPSFLTFAPGVPDTVEGPVARLRHAGQFLAEQGIDGIDILNIDAFGCEIPILSALAERVGAVRLIYLAFNDHADRLEMDQLLSPSHLLVASQISHVHRGRLVYVHRDALPSQTRANGARIDRRAIGGGASMDAAPRSPSPVAARAVARDVIETRASTTIQTTFEAAVVVTTILRPSLKKAVQSLYEQDVAGTMQLLIGIDQAVGDRAILDDLFAAKPANWAVSIVDPGYSTNMRNGGLYMARDGGCLRTAMSYLAHSRYVAYLDDDNWVAPNHISSLLTAIKGVDYAFSKRWFVDPETLEPIWIDEWESVGPDKGIFQRRFGGFCDPNTLMIDKMRCESAIQKWTMPLGGQSNQTGRAADRSVFAELLKYPGNGTNLATAYYVLAPSDPRHEARMELIAEARRQRGSAKSPTL